MLLYFGQNKFMPRIRLCLTVFLITVVSAAFSQQHMIIGFNNDTLKGRIMEVEKRHVIFMMENNETKKIPHTSISKANKNGLDYPMLNGRLSLFPYINSEKAGLFEVVEAQGRSAAELYKQAYEVVNSNAVEFNRFGDVGNSDAAFSTLMGVRSASTQVVDLMHQNDNPVKYSDPISQKLIVRVVNRYEGGQFGCVRLVWWEYDLILNFKDGRYRMELTNFSYNHYNNGSSVVRIQFGSFDEIECKSSGNIESLLQCKSCIIEFSHMYSYLVADSWRVMKLVEDGIKKQSTKKDEDW